MGGAFEGGVVAVGGGGSEGKHTGYRDTSMGK